MLLGDEFCLEAAGGVFGVGVVEAEGVVESRVGVFVDDAEVSEGGFAVAFGGFVAGVGAGDAGVGFDEGGAVEEFEGVGGFVDDDARVGEVEGGGWHVGGLWLVEGGVEFVDDDADEFAEVGAEVGALPEYRLCGDGCWSEAELLEGLLDAEEVVIGGAGGEGVEVVGLHEGEGVDGGGAGVDAEGVEGDVLARDVVVEADLEHGLGFVEGRAVGGFGGVDGAGEEEVFGEALLVEVDGGEGAVFESGGGGAVGEDAVAEDDGEIDGLGGGMGEGVEEEEGGGEEDCCGGEEAGGAAGFEGGGGTGNVER